MKRLLALSLTSLAAAAALVAQPGPGRGGSPNWRFVGAEPGRPGAVVTNAPFSAEVTTEANIVLPDGNKIRQTSSQKIYRDSDGRTRREQSLNSVGGLASNTNLGTVIFLHDPVGKVSYAISPSTRTATRSSLATRGFGPPERGIGPGASPAAMGRGQMRGRPDGPLPNVKTESLGRQTIEGVVADGTRTTFTIPAGQVGNEQPLLTVTESWYSADLQTEILYKRSDPRSGETITRYTNISRSEPSHSLFEVPADYKVTESGRSGRPGR